MKNKNLSWFAALLVFALLLWCTAATPGTIADPASYAPAVYSSMLSLLPPVVAIVLALNTKEVYTSLLVGIATGALLFANGNLELALNTLFFNEDGGMVAKLSDSRHVGSLVVLVMLGILVALMNKAGGSAAFGRWASTHIHTRAGAQFATLLLGILIFVDDYFNCLTVGSVMRPVTDRQKVSRAKLAYLIDATAAPICIIAPVSSWAAAVTSSVPEGSGINGFTMFLRTIPYNYYALLTIVMSLFLIFTGTDYCSMKQHEDNARAGDLFTTADRPYGDDVDAEDDAHGHVIDLVAPVLVLILAVFAAAVVAIGGWKGVRTLLGLSFTGAMIAWLILPGIYHGLPSLPLTVAALAVCTLVSLLLLNPPSPKTWAAMLSTLAGVALAGGVFYLFSTLLHLSGMNDTNGEGLVLVAGQTGLELHWLLLVAVLISSLGAVMDVALSLASSLHELREADGKMSGLQLFAAGMRIGRDMIGTMSNTLILAFAGEAVTTLLLLMAYGWHSSQLFASDYAAIQVAQGVASTLGVVLGVPITSGICAALYRPLKR